MTVTLLEGHVVDVLAAQPANFWHVCVTSPPYLWLRSYSTVPQVWEDGWVGELGQEPTPELYVEHLVAVFRSVRRVLRPDGTLWVNLAGCYYNDPGGQNGGVGNTLDYGAGRISPKVMEANRQNGRQKRGRHPWLKPLDWVDVPGLFAQAMQRDGWCWRSDVTWIKPSSLPESVSGTRWERCRIRAGRVSVAELEARGQQVPAGWDVGEHAHDRIPGGRYDTAAQTMQEWADCPGCPRCSANEGLVLRRGSGRPTKATERVLLFVKGPGYWFDQEAVREPASLDSHGGGRPGQQAAHTALIGGGHRNGVDGSTLNRPAAEAGRNLRDWWVIGPEPLRDAHYAAFPSALPERCIKAGTSEWGCCSSCGAPWARVINQRTLERYELPPEHEHYRPRRYTSHGEVDPTAGGGQRLSESTTLGWRPTCAPKCPGADQPPVPCRTLDPFGGSGTTALAANRLGRDCTLVELKNSYTALAKKRLGRQPLSLFAWRTAAQEDTPEEVQV